MAHKTDKEIFFEKMHLAGGMPLNEDFLNRGKKIAQQTGEKGGELIDQLQQKLGIPDWNSPEGQAKRQQVAQQAGDTYQKVTGVLAASIDDQSKARKIQTLLKGSTILSIILGVRGALFNSHIIQQTLSQDGLAGKLNQWFGTEFMDTAIDLGGVGGQFWLKLAIFLFVLRVLHKVLSKGSEIKQDARGLWNGIKNLFGGSKQMKEAFELAENEMLNEYQYPDNAETYQRLIDAAINDGHITPQQANAEYIVKVAQEIATEFDRMGLETHWDRLYNDFLTTISKIGMLNLKINEKDDKWIQKAVNPEHKGYCTPMTKDTCTPARKALAKRFKKGIEDESVVNELQGKLNNQTAEGIVKRFLADGNDPLHSKKDRWNLMNLIVNNTKDDISQDELTAIIYDVMEELNENKKLKAKKLLFERMNKVAGMPLNENNNNFERKVSFWIYSNDGDFLGETDPISEDRYVTERDDLFAQPEWDKFAKENNVTPEQVGQIKRDRRYFMNGKELEKAHYSPSQSEELYDSETNTWYNLSGSQMRDPSEYERYSDGTNQWGERYDDDY